MAGLNPSVTEASRRTKMQVGGTNVPQILHHLPPLEINGRRVRRARMHLAPADWVAVQPGKLGLGWGVTQAQ